MGKAVARCRGLCTSGVYRGAASEGLAEGGRCKKAC